MPVLAGRLCSRKNVLPKSSPALSWLQAAEGEPGQAGQTGEETAGRIKEPLKHNQEITLPRA